MAHVNSNADAGDGFSCDVHETMMRLTLMVSPCLPEEFVRTKHQARLSRALASGILFLGLTRSTRLLRTTGISTPLWTLSKARCSSAIKWSRLSSPTCVTLRSLPSFAESETNFAVGIRPPRQKAQARRQPLRRVRRLHGRHDFGAPRRASCEYRARRSLQRSRSCERDGGRLGCFVANGATIEHAHLLLRRFVLLPPILSELLLTTRFFSGHGRFLRTIRYSSNAYSHCRDLGKHTLGCVYASRPVSGAPNRDLRRSERRIWAGDVAFVQRLQSTRAFFARSLDPG